MKFQVVALKPLAGISKTSGKPYNMLAVSGILTDDDGVIHLGEVAFMDRADAPIPNNLVLGQSYSPVIGAGSRQGKLGFEIKSLSPFVAAKAA